MKGFVSKQEKEKKEKKIQTIIGISLVFIMALSVLGFGLRYGLGNQVSDSDTNTLIYNEFEFTYLNGFWKIGNFAFRYNPQEVPDLGKNLSDGTYYVGLPLYIYSENFEAQAEITRNLEQIVERIQPACLEGMGCSEDVPLKNCENNFIIIKESENEGIIQINKCVYIEGSQKNLTRLTDSFLFKILGVK